MGSAAMSNSACIILCHRAELLAQELKELQAELGDYNMVIFTALIS